MINKLGNLKSLHSAGVLSSRFSNVSKQYSIIFLIIVISIAVPESKKKKYNEKKTISFQHVVI